MWEGWTNETDARLLVADRQMADGTRAGRAELRGAFRADSEVVADDRMIHGWLGFDLTDAAPGFAHGLR